MLRVSLAAFNLLGVSLNWRGVDLECSTLAKLMAEFREHLTHPRGVKHDEEINICLLESRLEMGKSFANVVSFGENVSYLLTSMNLYEWNEQFLWTKQLLNWQDKQWHHYCKIAILSWWTKHWPPVHGLPQWTNLKWTTPKNNIPNEYFLMFLAASIIKLHITSAYVLPVQPLTTILNNCTWNKQLLNTN